MATPLTSIIVRILDRNGQTAGAGFVLTADGLLATCAHVVRDAGAGPGQSVRLAFHAGDVAATAYIEPAGWRDPAGDDLAILRLSGPLPAGVEPWPLGRAAGGEGHPFTTFGFPQLNPVGGLPGAGELLAATTLNNGARVWSLRSQEVTGGFSGAPVWDSQRGQIIGLVTATADLDRRGRLGETAFFTPLEELAALWPGLLPEQEQPAPNPFTTTGAIS